MQCVLIVVVVVDGVGVNFMLSGDDFILCLLCLSISSSLWRNWSLSTFLMLALISLYSCYCSKFLFLIPFFFSSLFSNIYSGKAKIRYHFYSARDRAILFNIFVATGNSIQNSEISDSTKRGIKRRKLCKVATQILDGNLAFSWLLVNNNNNREEGVKKGKCSLNWFMNWLLFAIKKTFKSNSNYIRVVGAVWLYVVWL